MKPAFIAEPGAVAYQAVRDTDLTSKRGQQTYLMDGLGLTRLQARDLIRAHELDQRDADARGVAREEFQAWFQRRGDIVQMRSKPRASSQTWRTCS
jgi:hypothetical protein